MENTLFDNNKLNKLISKYDEDLKPYKIDKEPVENWNRLLEAGKLVNEKNNYGNFRTIILERLLGYELEDLAGHELNLGEGRPVEFVINKNNKPYIVIELKGSKTKIDEKKTGRNAIQQATEYASITKSTEWCFVSNYDEFRLFKPTNRENYISFNFHELTNPDTLKKFLLTFSKYSLLTNNIVNSLSDDTIIIQKEIKDFEKEFYNLYSETRLMLIKELQLTDESIGKKGLNKLDSIHYAQLILNRYIFICFAEDKKLLPDDISITTLTKALPDVYKTELWHSLTRLFRFVNDGNPKKNIDRFNGGLFYEPLEHLFTIRDIVPLGFFDDCKKKYSFEEQENNANYLLKDYDETINPIFRNLLILSSFDFDTDLDVNILGHIFENSIGDIEELKGETTSKRKKDGVYYTPSYITDYICKNTIIPYLSKNGDVNTVDGLISEYNLSRIELEKLDSKIKNIKILDPACGSGAFLNKACDLLLEIHEKLHEQLYKHDKTLDRFFDDIKLNSVRRGILLDNIYGVDLNEESVEITKLGMFLKVAHKSMELPTLDNNIRCGNSLISDSTVAGDKAFNWNNEFEEVFANGGFDIVIGNPPYVRVQEIKHNELDYYSQKYRFTKGHVDLSILFIELANNIVKNNGLIGFIISNMFLTANYGENIREFLTKNIKIDQIVDFGDLNVFKDALTYVSIFILNKTAPQNFNYYKVSSLEDSLNEINFNKINIKDMCSKSWNLENYSLNKIFEKIKKFPTFKEIDVICNYGVVTGLDEVLSFKNLDEVPNIEKECLIPFIRPDKCNRYVFSKPEEYIIYPYKNSNGKTVLLSKEELSNEFPLLKEYLYKNKEKLKMRKDSRKTLENNPNWYKLIRPSYLEKFSNEKIVYSGLTKHNKFTIDKTGSACVGGGVFYINSLNPNILIEYVLAILNSSLIEIYLHSITPLKKGGYHKYSTKTINNLYLPQIPTEKQAPFVSNVKQIFELNTSKNNEIKSFINWLIRTFEIRELTTNLKNYHELTFEEFLKELKKKKVNTKSRDTQELLETEFNKSISIIKPLQEEIKTTDEKINELVYELYNLTPEEIKIIEENI